MTKKKRDQRYIDGSCSVPVIFLIFSNTMTPPVTNTKWVDIHPYIDIIHLSTILIVNIAMILHHLISKMVPTFMIFSSFYTKKCAQHPNTGQKIQCVCLINFVSVCHGYELVLLPGASC